MPLDSHPPIGATGRAPRGLGCAGRGLVVVALLVSVALLAGWWSIARRPPLVWRASAAVRAVQAAGGLVTDEREWWANEVEYRWPWEGGPVADQVRFVRPVADADLALVARCRTIGRLALGDVTAVTAAGFAQLGETGRLRQLAIGGPGLDAANSSGLGRLIGLDTLQLGPSGLADADLVPLRALVDLEVLQIRRAPGITGAGVAALVGSLPDLEYLDLADTGVDDAAIPGIGRLAGLATLILDRTRVTDAGLAPLGRSASLRSLGLAGTAVGDAGLALLGGGPATDPHRLRELDLRGTRVAGPGLARLARLGLLDHVVLADTRVDDAGVAGLAGLRGLAVVDLAGTSIGDAGCAHLARLPNLRELVVDRTAVGDRGLLALGQPPGLDFVSARDTPTTDRGAALLRQAVGGLRSIGWGPTGAAVGGTAGGVGTGR